MRKLIIASLLTLWLCLPGLGLADPFEPHASYSVCFTPGMNCTNQIVQSIDSAIKNVWVQAYSFTSRPIGKALVNAKERGVDVKIILDKSALSGGHEGAARYFKRHGIPIWIDNQPAIAHNKVIIVDQTKVITGSFNFTRAAQQNNAENVLIIDDANLAQKYLRNWQVRAKISNNYNRAEAVQSDWSRQDNWWHDLWIQFLNWLKHFFA